MAPARGVAAFDSSRTRVRSCVPSMERRCSSRLRITPVWALFLGVGWVVADGACAPRAPDAVPSVKSRAILGGTADTTHDAVMALLQMQTATKAYACSGTTIAQAGTSAYLLTSAHCVVLLDAMDKVVRPPTVVDPSVMTVLPGLDWQVSLSQGRKLTATAISVAPGYDGAPDSPNDVAIVRFTTSTPSLPLVPILEPADDALAAGSTLTLVGYGVTETGAQNALRRTVDRSIDSLTAKELRYLQNDMKGQCHGDSGGPALTRVAGAERVAGIMAYGQEIPSLGLYCRLESAAVRVSSLASFVHSVVGPVSAPDAGVPVGDGGATGSDAAVLSDAGPGVDAKPADAAPACGKVTDPRPACAACIASRCCIEAAVCGANPLCLPCGANPLPSCQAYPPSATLTACLATCTDNPCGVRLDAGAGPADAAADAPAGDASQGDASAGDASWGVDAARDAASNDAPADAVDALDASHPPDAGAPADAAVLPDARPSDASADGMRNVDATVDAAGQTSDGGCAVSGRFAPTLSVWWIVWSILAAWRARPRRPMLVGLRART